MSEITLHDAAQRYLEHLKAQGKSDRTTYTYKKDLEQVESFFGADKKLDSILTVQVGKFLKSDALLKLPNGNDRSRNNRDRSEATVKKTIRVFRMFMVWSLDQGFIEKLPLPKDFAMGHSKVTESQDGDSS